MTVSTFIFNEVSPSSAITISSSAPVQGADPHLPGGICGLLGDYSSAAIIGELTGAQGGSLSVVVQGSPDGLNFFDLIRFPVISAGAATAFYSSPLSTKVQTATPVVVGKNLVPALAANTTVNAPLTDRLRLVMIAGSGTTAGAQVIVRVCAHRKRVRETGV